MLGLPDDVRACLFDLDGVLTSTAVVHAAAWKQMFDGYLRERAEGAGEPFAPFDIATDYVAYVDGKPRNDGTRDFLASRGIVLSDDEVRELGLRKNEIVLRLIREGGVQAYPGSVDYLRRCREAGLARVVVSSSTNCRDVLVAAGVIDLVDGYIDGIVAEQRRSPGQARARHLPGRGRAGRRRTPPGGGVRGRPGRRGGGPGGRVPLRGRRRPGGPRRRPPGPRRRHRGPRPERAAVSVGVRARVITEPTYVVEPWCVRETELRLDLLSQSESVFALSNGHIGLRGNLDEGEPYGVPGTYLNGVYELRPLPYAEAGYGYPESGQSVINVTNGKLLRLLVDDEPFDVRYGVVRSHERSLDLRAGTLTRRVEWVSPAGQAVRVTSVRLVSLTQRAVAAISYTVEAVGEPARVVVQSELVANEAAPVRSGDPRVAAAIDSPLQSEDHAADGQRVILVHGTKASRIRMAAGMDHVVEGPSPATAEGLTSTRRASPTSAGCR